MHPIPYVHLGVNTVEMFFYRMDADIHFLGNVFIGQSMYRQIQHLSLPTGQTVLTAQLLMVPFCKEITGVTLFSLIYQTVCKVLVQLLQYKHIPFTEWRLVCLTIQSQ